jgi:hypothetical protein
MLSDRFRCAVLISTLALPALADDLTIVSKYTGPMNTAGTSTQYFSSSKFRSGRGETEMIFDVAASTMTVIDNRKKEYWTSTLAEMNSTMTAASDQLKQAQDRAKSDPRLNDPRIKDNPMVAQALERAMGGGTAAPLAVSVEKGPNPKKIAGYDCEYWVASMGPGFKMEMWTTGAIALPTQFWETRQAMVSANPMMKNYAKLFEEMKKIKGFALGETTTMSFAGQSMTTSSEATEVKRGPVPESTFAVPAGYTKVESPMKKAAANMKQPRG